ncbi:hypothetical protein H0H81_002501 [Sphagnurus paluster]|uniref:Uncharacterized protein n=1 Tax=Sphagnurus paluster TaxID=117069 RepID=A0A9P7GI31_9AGAR|nr:hypothetical protein H0H81_002501 [Sphagnurus paluster]
MSSPQLNDVSFEISHHRGPDFLTDIRIKAIHTTSTDTVATLRAFKILRQFCKGSFLEAMDCITGELHQFSVKLFDKYGLYQGAGLGYRILEQLVESTYVQMADTLMCWPAPSRVSDPTEWVKIQKRQINFFRQFGFRRVGRTDFFAYSPDPTHPSHSIPISGDAENLSEAFDSSAETGLSKQDMARKYPLHTIIMNSTGGQWVINTIRAHYLADESSIHVANAQGFTPIHIALKKANVDAVRTLLDLGVMDDLQKSQNAEGVTPLEGLTEAMQSNRDFAETLLGQWDSGYSADELTCEFLIKRALGMPTMPNDLQEYIAQRKWGCTCGSCAGGWLSKRMQFRLLCQAGMYEDMMEGEKSQFLQGKPHSDPMSLCDNASSYLPPHLHASVFKMFYIGFQSVFRAIIIALKNPDYLFGKDLISALSAGQRGVNFYFGKGGKIEYALDAITDAALEQSLLGSGDFEDTWDEEDDFKNLPMCDADLEFGLVRRMMGLNPAMRWGPY